MIHKAAQSGSSQLIEILLSHNPSLSITTRNNDGHTPLMLASIKGHLDVVKLLASKLSNVDLHAKDKVRTYILYIYVLLCYHHTIYR